jgi:hypothetical protein
MNNGDMTSMCCCVVYPGGFDIYGMHLARGFLHNDTALVDTGQLTPSNDNWFVDWLTRVNVLGAGVDGEATPEAFSAVYTAPVTRPTDRPEPPDAGFYLGTFRGTALNTKDGLVLWNGQYSLLDFDGLGNLVEVAGVDDGNLTYVAVITTTGLTATVVDQYKASNDGTEIDGLAGGPINYIPALAVIGGGNREGIAFDVDRAYFNPVYWFEDYSPSQGEYIQLSNNGTTGCGMIGGDFVDDVDRIAYPHAELRDGVYPWYAKTLHLAAEAFLATFTDYEPVSNGTTTPGTVVTPGNLQDLWNTQDQAWATYIARDDPTTAWGYKVTVTIHEEPTSGEAPFTMPNNPRTYTDKTWLETISRELVLGEPDADGLVVGDTVWSSGDWQANEYDPPGFPTYARDLYGMTGAALECDSWADHRAGIYFTTGGKVETPKGSRTINHHSINGTYYTANNVTVNLPTDLGSAADMVEQLNTVGITRDEGDAKVGVVLDGAEVFHVSLYHPGWIPQAVRVAHDNTGDLFIVERYASGGITPYSDAGVGGIGQGLLGVVVKDANDDHGVNTGATSGNRAVLVAAYKGTLADVHVANSTNSSTGSHTVLQSGAVGDWDFELIEFDTTATNARYVWAERTTDGILAFAMCHSTSSSYSYTVGTVGTTPTAPTGSVAAMQVCFAAAPVTASVQGSKILLTGDGRLSRYAYDDDGVDRVQAFLTVAPFVWDSELANDWTFGDEVEGTIGLTVTRPLTPSGSWANSSAAESPAYVTGDGSRLRRVTPEGATTWVMRGLADSGNFPDHVENSNELVLAEADGSSLVYNARLLAIDAVTGEARVFDYPDATSDWYSQIDDPLLRWSMVPIADQLSTQNLATWIAASPVPHGVGETPQ